jgi:hypothetical protein
MNTDSRNIRKEPRVVQREAIRVILGTTPAQTRSAIMVDRSESGIGLRLAVQVHVGQPIVIEGVNFRVSGRIQWVAAHDGFYSAGVALAQRSAAPVRASAASRVA